jgi:hypothetical protein
MSNITLTNNKIAAGAPYKVNASITWTGATISSVQAVLVNTLGAGSTIVEITSAATLTLDSGAYKGILAASETAKLLTDPTNANSTLKYRECYLVITVTGIDADGDALTPILNSTKITVGRAPLANLSP